jgi:hypothetical protein
MITLNQTNGADLICLEYTKKLMKEFDEHLYGCEMGIAYGGGVESIGKQWGDRGTVYGFDTFEDLHPKHLEKDTNSFAATCMDGWYTDKKLFNKFGIENASKQITYEYQTGELKRQGLDVILIKGEVHPESCKDIPKLHYAFLDMDMLFSMEQGFKAVKDKIVKGGYLLLHDTQNIGELTKWRDEVVYADPSFEKVDQHDRQLVVIMQKVGRGEVGG